MLFFMLAVSSATGNFSNHGSSYRSSNDFNFTMIYIAGGILLESTFSFSRSKKTEDSFPTRL